MSKVMMNSLALVGISVLVSACGGGGMSTPIVTLQNAESTQQITMISADFSNSNVIASSSTIAQLNRLGAIELTYGAILSDGKVIGIETLSSDVPTSGTATYNGTAVAVINDGSYFYDLVGTATATVALASQSGALDVTLGSFSGEQTSVLNGATANGSFPNISIIWENANICDGSRFCNGLIDVQGTATNLSQEAKYDATAVLFGPLGEEIGGLIDVVDPGNLEATAGFIVGK